MKIPKGQKLVDELQKMTGNKLVVFRPHKSYDDCRIVEDWIWENGLFGLYRTYLEREWEMGEMKSLLLSTPLQRCRCAWMAGVWKETK